MERERPDLKLVEAPEPRGDGGRDGRAGPTSGPGADPEGLRDAELVLAAREGARWAQQALFERHVSWVDGLAYRLMAGMEQDADDVVQDAFVEALANLGKLREPAAFRGWLRTIVVHVARRRLRRKRLRARLGLQSLPPPDLENLVSAQAPPDVAAELRRVYGRVHALPTDLRMVLLLRKVEGWTVPEIARHLGVSEGTVKRRLRRAERRLEESWAQRREP